MRPVLSCQYMTQPFLVDFGTVSGTSAQQEIWKEAGTYLSLSTWC